MTDNFENAKDKILRQARANGGVTTEHLLDAICALADDQDAQHQESMTAIRKNRDVLGVHIEESKVRDHRLDELEEFAVESRTTCKERIEKLIREEHDARHGDHMTAYHSNEGDFQERMLWFFATATGKIALIIIGAVAAIALNYILYGRP